MSIVHEVQNILEVGIDKQIASNRQKDMVGLFVVVFFLIIVIGCFPFIVWSTRRTTLHIQHFAVNLVDKTKEIRQEKQRTDSLLRQMLPVEIVDQLKQQKTTAAEYFECVTIFFSDVVGFSDYCARYSPIHVVELLNSLYRLFDDVITHYDVYKVETINDSYMVSSGELKNDYGVCLIYRC